MNTIAAPTTTTTTAVASRHRLLHAAIVALATATALIHWSLMVTMGGIDPPFLLNGIGYFVLLWALFSNAPVVAERRALVHYVFMGYVAITILAWVFMGQRDLRGYADKVIEVLLFAALWLHLRATEREARGTAG